MLPELIYFYPMFFFFTETLYESLRGLVGLSGRRLSYPALAPYKSFNQFNLLLFNV